MIYPIRRYERIIASVLLAGTLTGTGLGIKQRIDTQPPPTTNLQVCFLAGFIISFKWCFYDSDKPKKEPPKTVEPCSPPLTCDPQVQTCP